MIEEFSYTGYWWLPDDPEQKWAGTVTFSPDTGIELELMVETEHGALDTPFLIDINVFYGMLPNHPGRVSLLNNSLHRESEDASSRNIVVNGETKSLVKCFFKSEYLISGKFVPSLKDVSLKALDVSFSSLKEFMDPEITEDVKQVQEGTAVRFDSHVEPLAFTTHAIKAQILLVRGDYIGIRPASAKDLHWYLTTIESLRKLIALLSGIPMQYKNISSDLDGGDFHVIGSDPNLDIFFQDRQPELTRKHSSQSLFSPRVLGQYVEPVFENWFEMRDDLRVPFSLCLNVIQCKWDDPILDFLALVQALQNYRRLCFEETEESKDSRNLVETLKELRRNLPVDLVESTDFSDELMILVQGLSNCYWNNFTAQENAKLDHIIAQLVPCIGYFLYRTLGIHHDVINTAFERSKKYGLWQRRWPLTPRIMEELVKKGNSEPLLY